MTTPFLIPSEREIRSLCNTQSYERGHGYFQNNAIFDTVRRGTTIHALCAGTADEPYRVQATLNGSGSITARCSCPVGADGACKHVAALLLTWRAHPESFTAAEDLETTLGRRPKAELIALLKYLLVRQPELEDILDLTFPGGSGTRAPLDPAPYRRQVAAMIAEHGESWGGNAALADGLQALIAIAQGFEGEPSHANAATVYGAMASEIIACYRDVRYAEGALFEAVSMCLHGLDRCLQETTGPTARPGALRALFEIIRINLGGDPERDLGYEQAARILVHRTTREERRQVVEWIDTLNREFDHSDDRDPDDRDLHADSLASLRFDLEKDTLDDEAFLAACRARGRVRELIDRLLWLGRFTEAQQESERLGSYSLLLIADTFAQYGQSARIKRVIEARLAESADADLHLWLRDYQAAHGDDRAALAHAEHAFELRPSLEDYRALRQLAQRVETWESVRREALARLEASSSRQLRIQALLDDGDLDLVVQEVLRDWPESRGRHSGHGGDLLLEVAIAAERDQPEAALEIYRRLVEWYIGERDRASYRVACQILQRTRAIHEHQGSLGAWINYLADLRRRTRALRALHEEMGLADL